MPRSTRLLLALGLCPLLACSGRTETVAGNGNAQGDTPAPAGTCRSSLRDFASNVWQPVMGQKCYGCHHTGGLAQMMGAGFVLADANLPSAMAYNYDATRQRALTDPNFLLKPTNQVPHYGGDVTPVDGEAYKVLADFVAHASDPPVEECGGVDLGGVTSAAVFAPAATSLRKASLTLAARLPTADELAAVASQGTGTAGTDRAIAAYVEEDAFYDRLEEWYNDALLTDKYAAAPMGTGLYPDVGGIKWFDAKPWSDPNAYAYAVAQTNLALAREPLHLIAYTVRHELPFTNVVTSQQTVVNPFSACALGVQAQVRFKTAVTCDPSEVMGYDPHDLQPVQVDPHQVGVLSTRAFLSRHTTTPTNRNRHRYNTIATIFLGSNTLELSPVRLAASAAGSVKNPTLTLRDCTVCHAVMDPGAGLLQQYDPNGMRTSATWYEDMFAPGYGGTPLPATAAADPLRFLGDHLAGDPRFARQAVAMLFGMLTGKTAPKLATDAQTAAAGYDLYTLQSQAIDNWTQLLTANNYNLKAVAKAIIASPFFTVTDAKSDASPDKFNLAAALVHSRVMTPEELDRKLTGLFGQSWTDAGGSHLLLHDMYMFYGGINSDTVTNRASNTSGFMANIGLRLGTDMACRVVPRALSGDDGAQAQRLRTLLFPQVTLNDTPTSAPAAVRANIVKMFWNILGEDVAPTSQQVTDAVTLLTQTMAQVTQDKATALSSTCAVTAGLDGSKLPAGAQLTQDPTGVVQGWMAVFSYLLADFDFLYE